MNTVLVKDSRREEKTFRRLTFEDYQNKYSHFQMERSDGILEVTLNDGNGGPVSWNLSCYEQAISALQDIGADRENRAIILTGAGDAFIGSADLGDPAESGTTEGFDPFFWHGSRLGLRLLDIEAPIIAAVNGPAVIHTEIPLLSDIVLASDNAYFQDSGHIPGQIVPGDGCQVIWEELLGPVQAKYFLWRSQQLDAARCLELGVVNEVLSSAALLPRARELAQELAALPALTRRYTRLALNQRLKRRFAEAVSYGMALEGITVFNVFRQS
jgi:enoyl-CoA hydratase/carnithine racemase